MAKTIKTFVPLLGGFAFRVTEHQGFACYQERSPSSGRFVTRARETIENFRKWADDIGLYDPYRNEENPSVVEARIRQLTLY